MQSKMLIKLIENRTRTTTEILTTEKMKSKIKRNFANKETR